MQKYPTFSGTEVAIVGKLQLTPPGHRHLHIPQSIDVARKAREFSAGSRDAPDFALIALLGWVLFHSPTVSTSNPLAHLITYYFSHPQTVFSRPSISCHIDQSWWCLAQSQALQRFHLCVRLCILRWANPSQGRRLVNHGPKKHGGLYSIKAHLIGDLYVSAI